MGKLEPDKLNLDVYDAREGLWNPEYGDLELPDGWEFLPTGDAFITRQVKTGGRYWVLWRPRGRNRPHRRLLGLLAPKAEIEAATAQAQVSAEARTQRAIRSAGHRARAEDVYRVAFAEAIVVFLDFAPEHADLARAIAAEAAGRAAEVGSGRVGRTRTLHISERAALAARALIRHRHTDYEDRLAGEVWDDDYLYREAKRDAHHAVDAFVEHHRRTSTGPHRDDEAAQQISADGR